jgi:hypothetical protein
MRDILVHDYDGVNIGIVTDELPRNRGTFGTATAAIQRLKLGSSRSSSNEVIRSSGLLRRISAPSSSAIE